MIRKNNGSAFFATYATPPAKVLSRFLPSATSKPHIATCKHRVHTWRPVLEECGRFVSRPFLAKVALLSTMLGITLHLFPFQSNPSSSPAVSASQSRELDCDGKRTKARQFTDAGNSSGALKLLADVYATCPG